MSTSTPITTLSRKTINTPLGDMIGVASDSGIALFAFADSPYFERDVSNLARRLSLDIDNDIIDHDHPLLIQLEREIGEYFSGDRQYFEVPLHLAGSSFEVGVWEVLRQIPYGTTCSYAQEARLLGRPTTTRAVANANGRNLLPILIPCHRVISSDGSLGGYSGGIQRKIELLKTEGILML